MISGYTPTPEQRERDRHERKLWTEQHAQRHEAVKDKTASALARDNQHLFWQGMRVLEVWPGDIPVDARAFYEGPGTHNYMIEIASPAVVKVNTLGRELESQHHRDFRAVRASMREFDVWWKFLQRYLGASNWLDWFFARSSLHVQDNTLIEFFRGLWKWTKPGTKFLIEGKTTNDPKISRSQEVAPGLFADPVEDGHLRHGWSHENVEQLCRALRWNVEEIGIRQQPAVGHDKLMSEFLYFVATQK